METCHDLPYFLTSAFCLSRSQLPRRRDGAQQPCEVPSTFAGTISVLARRGNLTGDPETAQVMAQSCMKPGVRARCTQGWTQPRPRPSPAEPWMMGRVRKCHSYIANLLDARARGNIMHPLSCLNRWRDIKLRKKWMDREQGVGDHVPSGSHHPSTSRVCSIQACIFGDQLK